MPGRNAEEAPTTDDPAPDPAEGDVGRARAVDGLLRELARAGEGDSFGDDERFVGRVMSLVRAGGRDGNAPSAPGVTRAPGRKRRLAVIVLAASAAAAVVLAFLARAVLEGRYPGPQASGAYVIAGGGPLRRGATLTTEKGTATLELGGYCRIDIGPGTSLRMEGGEKAEHVFLSHGKIACEVDRSGGSFTVLTDVEESRIEVDGTRFTVEVIRAEGDAEKDAEGENEMRRKRLSVKVLVGSVLVAGTWGQTRAIAGEAVDVPRPGGRALVAGKTAEPPLAAKVLPARTLALFVVENVTRTAEAFEETGIYKLWQEAEVQSFIEPIRPKVRAILTKAEEAADLKFADLTAAFGGQIGLALVGLQLREGEGKARGDPLPEVALVAEITDHAAAVRLLARARVAIEQAGDVRLKTWDVGPLSFGRIAREGERMELGYILTQSAFYVGLGPDGRLLTEMLAAATAGVGETLAEEEELLAAVERAGARRDLFAYVNVRGLIDIGFDLAARRNTPPERLAIARRALEILGLDTVRSVFFAEAVDPPGFRSQLFVHAPSPRKGLFGLVSEEPVRESMLRLAPGDGRSLAAVRLQSDRALPLVREFLGLIAPRAVERLERQLAQLKENTGIDVERDLFGGLGLEGEIIVAPVAVAGMAPMAELAGISLVMRLARPEDFRPVYEILMLMAQGLGARRRVTVSESAGPGGARIRSFTIPFLNPWGIVPSAAMTDRHLVISLSAEAVRAVCGAILEAPPEPLVAGADYMKALARAGVEPGFLVSYTRPMRAKDLQPMLSMAPFAAIPLAGVAADAKTPPELSDLIRSIDLTRLPSAATLTRHGFSQIAVGWTNEDGVGLTTYGQVGISAGAVAVGGAGLVATLPRLFRLREGRDRRRCTANLRRVWTGLSGYARDHDGKFPAELGDLAPNHVAAAQALRCPVSGRPYTYVSGLTAADRTYLVVVYEAPGNHRRGANLVQVGGIVRWRPNAEFVQRQVDAQVTRLRAQGRSVKVIGPQAAPAAVDEPEEFF